MKVTYNWLLVVLLFLYSHLTVEAKGLPFQDREKLEFSLRWFGFIGGKSVIEASPVRNMLQGNSEDNSAKSYLLKATLRTVAVADIPFRVRDEFSSLITVESGELIPQWYEVSQKEKNYQYQKKIDYSEMEQRQKGLQNPLSALYFLRMRDLKCRQIVEVPVHTHGKTYPVKIEVLSYEKLKIYGDTFDTIVVGISLGNKKVKVSSVDITDLKIWLSNDKMKLPLLMKADTSIGPITVLLDNRKEFFRE